MKIIHITTAHPRSDNRVYDKIYRSVRSVYTDTRLFVADGLGDDVDRGIVDVCRGRAKNIPRVLKIFKMWLFLRKYKNYVLHFHDPELLPVIFLMSFYNTVIFDIHEHYMSRIPERFQNKYAGYLVYIVLLCLTKLVRVSAHFILAEESYSKHYKSAKKTVEVRNYPKLEKFEKFWLRREKPDETIKLVYVGSITHERGLAQMLDLLQCNKDHSAKFKIELHLIGDGPDISSVRETKHCIKHGRLPVDEAYAVASQCDFGLCLLAPLDNYLRSLPTKILEYSALNLPFFVVNHEYYKDICRGLPGAIFVDYDKPAQIIDFLNRIYDDEHVHRQLLMNSLYENKYTWDTEKTSLLTLYSNIEENGAVT